ncbi:hypothetical protein EVA_01444 [gut metagenome]|uniref:Uncharacterized protein n=1 Tax=gut metagenome TaxID=749906 RepID=J9H7U0_9ZZZZ
MQAFATCGVCLHVQTWCLFLYWVSLFLFVELCNRKVSPFTC